VIVDDYTRYTWVFFLYDKSDVHDLFKSFVKRVQNEFETTIKKIRSDNGSEFKNTRIVDLCDDLGIRHQFSPTYTPQSNGVVERKSEHDRLSATFDSAMASDVWRASEVSDPSVRWPNVPVPRVQQLV
jgi:transposase InsO family protein